MEDPEVIWYIDPVWVMEFVRFRELTEGQERSLLLSILELHEREKRALADRAAA